MSTRTTLAATAVLLLLSVVSGADSHVPQWFQDDCNGYLPSASTDDEGRISFDIPRSMSRKLGLSPSDYLRAACLQSYQGYKDGKRLDKLISLLSEDTKDFVVEFVLFDFLTNDCNWVSYYWGDLIDGWEYVLSEDSGILKELGEDFGYLSSEMQSWFGWWISENPDLYEDSVLAWKTEIADQFLSLKSSPDFLSNFPQNRRKLAKSNGHKKLNPAASDDSSSNHGGTGHSSSAHHGGEESSSGGYGSSSSGHGGEGSSTHKGDESSSAGGGYSSTAAAGGESPSTTNNHGGEESSGGEDTGGYGSSSSGGAHGGEESSGNHGGEESSGDHGGEGSSDKGGYSSSDDHGTDDCDGVNPVDHFEPIWGSIAKQLNLWRRKDVNPGSAPPGHGGPPGSGSPPRTIFRVNIPTVVCAGVCIEVGIGFTWDFKEEVPQVHWSFSVGDYVCVSSDSGTPAHTRVDLQIFCNDIDDISSTYGPQFSYGNLLSSRGRDQEYYMIYNAESDSGLGIAFTKPWGGEYECDPGSRFKYVNSGPIARMVPYVETLSPTSEPTVSPTAKPTGTPTYKPSKAPTPKPTPSPTPKPVPSPTPKPIYKGTESSEGSSDHHGGESSSNHAGGSSSAHHGGESSSDYGGSEGSSDHRGGSSDAGSSSDHKGSYGSSDEKGSSDRIDEETEALGASNPKVSCHTAYIYTDEATSTCFEDEDTIKSPNKRWGWAVEIQDGQTLDGDIIGGTQHCDVQEGTRMGTFTMTLHGCTLTIDYNKYAGVSHYTEMHLQYGNQPYAKNDRARISAHVYNSDDLSPKESFSGIYDDACQRGISERSGEEVLYVLFRGVGCFYSNDKKGAVAVDSPRSKKSSLRWLYWLFWSIVSSLICLALCQFHSRKKSLDEEMAPLLGNRKDPVRSHENGVGSQYFP